MQRLLDGGRRGLEDLTLRYRLLRSVRVLVIPLRSELGERGISIAPEHPMQGGLDMAFDKFKKCPLDDQLMDTLYNLALDFERKRQFNKAGAIQVVRRSLASFGTCRSGNIYS